MTSHTLCSFFFFFNDTATTEIYTLSLHDALPISRGAEPGLDPPRPAARRERARRRAARDVRRGAAVAPGGRRAPRRGAARGTRGARGAVEGGAPRLALSDGRRLAE